MTDIVGFPSQGDYDRARRVIQREERRPQDRPLPRGRWTGFDDRDSSLIEKAEVKDDLEEGGDSAECYLMKWSAGDDKWVRRDPPVIVDVYPDAGFLGCAFKTDLVDVVAVTEGAEPRYEALDGGRVCILATASADQTGCTLDTDGAFVPFEGEFPAAGPVIYDGSAHTTSITIKVALTNWEDGDFLTCWWESDAQSVGEIGEVKRRGRWIAGRFGFEEIDCTLRRYTDGEGKKKLGVDVSNIAGPGLVGVPGDDETCSKLAVVPPPGDCGIHVDSEDGTITVDLTELVEEGNGLSLTEDPDCPQLQFSISCGLVDDGSGNLAVDVTTLVNTGNGLKVASGGGCDAIEMNVSCGLVDDGSGNLQVDLSTIAGAGLTVVGGSCGALSVDCDYVYSCVTDKVTNPPPGNPLVNSILDAILGDPSLLSKLCAAVCACSTDPPELDCEATGGAPIYEWDGAAWNLVDACDCGGETVPPDGDGCATGTQRPGTCFDCAGCEGLPIYRWVTSAWVLEDNCDCLTPTPPLTSGTEGELACGICFDCTTCEGNPVYLWTSGDWALQDNCDCLATSTPPDTTGTEGDLACGTCEIPITCEDSAGLPVYRWNGSEWVLFDACDCTDTLEAPDTPGEEAGEYGIGTCVKTCEDCAGDPVYTNDGMGNWTLVDACDCDGVGDTPTEPVTPPTEDGEYGCGTCETVAPSDCGPNPAFSCSTIGSASYSWSQTACSASAFVLPTGSVEHTNYMVGADFRLDGGDCVPSTATIVGIEVKYRCRCASGTIQEDEIRLSKNNGSTWIGNNNSNNANWPTSWTTQTRGGPSDLWGTTWTAAEVRSISLAMGIRVKSIDGSTSGNPEVDSLEIKVYWTP